MSFALYETIMSILLVSGKEVKGNPLTEIYKELQGLALEATSPP